jgi:hypothetical protein
MAANAQMTMVTQEPRFYGTSEAKEGKGLTAEDFIARIQDLKESGNWGEAETAVKAISWLRNSAYQFFNTGLRLSDRRKYDAVRNGWAAFKTEFSKRYFEVKVSTDLSMDWHNLKQLEKETAQEFVCRVVSVYGKYSDLLQQHEMTAEDAEPLRRIFVEVGPDAVTEFADFNANIRDRINAELLTLWNGIRDRTKTDILMDQALNTAAAGLRSQKVRDALLKCIRAKMDMDDILQRVSDTESMASRKEPLANKPYKSSGQQMFKGVASATEAEDHYAEEEDVATIGGKKNNGGHRGGRGGGPRGRGARGGGARGGRGGAGAQHQTQQGQTGHMPALQHNGQADAATRAQVRANTCFNCNQQGHWRADCPLKTTSAAQETEGPGLMTSLGQYGSGFHSVGALNAQTHQWSGNEWA